METKNRLDSHHNDGHSNEDDFLLLGDTTSTNQLPNPYGICSDATTLWVSDFDDGKIYAYDLTWHQSTVNTNKSYAKGTRAFWQRRKFTLRQQATSRLWANDETLWVAFAANSLLAYNLLDDDATIDDKTRDSSKDIILSDINGAAPQILYFWMNETTIWIIHFGNKTKLYAYKRGTDTKGRQRQAGSRFREGRQSNNRRKATSGRKKRRPYGNLVKWHGNVGFG